MKSANIKAKSFLASRIFFILLILVVLPLFIYTIFLYKTEYKQTREDIYLTLSIIGSQIEKNIEDNLDVKDQVLTSVFDEMKKNDLNFNNLLKKRSNEFDLKGLFYFSLEQGNFRVKNSSEDLKITNVNALKGILNAKNTLFLTTLLDCKDCIYFSKRVMLNDKPVAALVVAFLKKDLLIDFPKDKYFSQVKMAIVDNGNTILSNITSKGEKNLNNTTKSSTSKQILVKKDIKNSNLKVALSLDENDVKKFHINSFIFKHLYILSIIFIILLLLSLIFIVLMTKPIGKLLRTMQKVKEGKIDRRYKKQKFGFEINYIGNFFNETIDSLILKQKEVEKEKIEKQKYLEELKIGEEIQMSLLPQKPLDVKGLDIAFGNLFAKEVGGDFYDFFEKNGQVFFVIADIATKGILACLYALNLRSIIRSFAFELNSLEKIIFKTNQVFLKDTQNLSMFATAFFGMYDPKSRILRYSNAGHQSAILRKKYSTITELTTKGIALGVKDLKDVYVNEVTLEKEDLIFLYTDGIIDAIDVKNRFFGKENLINFIKDTDKLASYEIIEKLFSKLETYSKDTFQYDDMTALVFKIR